MIAYGRVQDGVIVLDNGVRLPEGQEVTVMALVRCHRSSGWKARVRTASSTLGRWAWAQYFFRSPPMTTC